MWLKLGIILSTLLIFSACADEKQTVETVKVEKRETYGIPWERDLPTAFEKAKKENKMLMVMAVSVGCRWCDKMKEKTLSNPAVAKKLKNYILVQADRETPNERDQLPEFKHVPIIFFMKPNKEVIDNLRGYFAPDDFLEYLNEMDDL